MNKTRLPRLSWRLVSKDLYLFLIPAILMLAGCSSQTLFQSNFDSAAIGQPPSHGQQVGTVNTDGPAGSVTTVASPVTTGGNFVQVSRNANATSVSGLQCNFSKFAGVGQYTFSAVMYIPAGSGLATIQFETFNQPVSTYTNFLHLDFTEDNMVRLDDMDSTKFGSFPRGQVFIVQVTLNINATAPTAHIVLSGAGASGARDYKIIPALIGMAQQFGAVRLWMGFPWTGSFDTNTIVVTYQSS
ncbi:MAG TPA: hypothetical protein VMI35_10695 [Puia sp.]|nr:hypothetical protein [Puia sp.]